MKKLFKTLAVILLTSAATFASVKHDKMAVKEIETFEIGMYKMKNTSTIRLMLNKYQSNVVSVNLTDKNGNILYRDFISKKQMKYRRDFDMSGLKDGTYTFTIANGIEEETHNVVISTNSPELQTYRELTIK